MSDESPQQDWDKVFSLLLYYTWLRVLFTVWKTYFFPNWTTLPISIWVKNCSASFPCRSEEKCYSKKIKRKKLSHYFKKKHSESEHITPTCSTSTEWWSFPLFCSDVTNPFMLMEPTLSSRKSACFKKKKSFLNTQFKWKIIFILLFLYPSDKSLF